MAFLYVPGKQRTRITLISCPQSPCPTPNGLNVQVMGKLLTLGWKVRRGSCLPSPISTAEASQFLPLTLNPRAGDLLPEQHHTQKLGNVEAAHFTCNPSACCSKSTRLCHGFRLIISLFM